MAKFQLPFPKLNLVTKRLWHQSEIALCDQSLSQLYSAKFKLMLPLLPSIPVLSMISPRLYIL